MAIAADHSDLRYAVEFVSTPMTVDLLRAARRSAATNACLDIASDDDAVRHAIQVLIANGTVTCAAGEPSGGQRLSLTPKGHRVCGLLDELVDDGQEPSDALVRDHTWLPDEQAPR